MVRRANALLTLHRRNFINVVVGAGIVILPWVCAQAGFWVALAEMVVCCILTDFSVNMLVSTGIRHNVDNYENLCLLAFGKVGHTVCSFTMFIFDYG
jgi:amino acid permease